MGDDDTPDPDRALLIALAVIMLLVGIVIGVMLS
jgi:hypothetical protein